MRFDLAAVVISPGENAIDRIDPDGTVIRPGA
jgi:hypothetical protein